MTERNDNEVQGFALRAGFLVAFLLIKTISASACNCVVPHCNSFMAIDKNRPQLKKNQTKENHNMSTPLAKDAGVKFSSNRWHISSPNI